MRIVLPLLCAAAVMAAPPAAYAQGFQPVRYVGVEVCASCHGQDSMGNQMLAWTGSMHARSFLALGTGYAEMIPRQARGMVDVGHGRAIAEEAKRVGKEADCLVCHATAAGIDEELRAETFHVEDGVQCEACHGPGSAHAAAMHETGRSRAAGHVPPQARLRRSSLHDCLRCHRDKPSHAALGRGPFDPVKRWQRIAHPMPTK